MDNVRVILGRAAEPLSSSLSAPGGQAVQAVGGTSAISDLRSGFGDVAEGRLSLLMLDTIVLGFVLLYIWTRKVQAAA